jgi:hypothetical protein
MARFMRAIQFGIYIAPETAAMWKAFTRIIRRSRLRAR